MKPTESDMLMAKFFAGEATPEEQKTLLYWRESSPDNEATFTTSRQIWEQSLAADWEPDVTAAWSMVQQRTQPVAKFLLLQRKQWMQLAAAMFLVSGLIWIYTTVYNPTVQITTASNEVKKVVLPDGSQVWLNHSSQLSYRKKLLGKQRVVDLNGEAYFEVTKNAEKPFVIHTEQANVQVLGTAFNLKAIANTKAASLNVTEGKVQFTSKYSNESGIVVAGQKALIDNQGKLQPIEPMVINDMAWKSDQLVFNNMPMKEVCRILENHFNIVISVTDSNIYNCHFTATFNKPKLSKVLSVVCQTLQLTYSQKGQQIVLDGKGCKQ